MVDNWKSGILWSCIYNMTVNLEASRYCQTSAFSPISTLATPVSVKDYYLVQQHLWNHYTHIQSYAIFKKNPQEMTMLYLFDGSHITGEQPALVNITATCTDPFL